MKGISLSRYIAFNNTRGAQAMLKEYGIPKARGYEDLVQKLNFILKKYRTDGLYAMANIHPDRELIIEAYKQEKGSNACGESHSSCNGDKDCGCGCKSNFDGASKVTPQAEPKRDVATSSTINPEPRHIPDYGTRQFVTNVLPYMALGVGVVILTKAIS